MKVRLQILFFGCACLVALPGQAGEIYRWKDANGNVQFSDGAPTGGEHVEVTKAKEPTSIKMDGSSRNTGAMPETDSPRDVSQQVAAEHKQQDQEKLQRENEKKLKKQQQKEKQDRIRSSENQEEARRKAAVDRCNENRESYCNKGYDEITKQEQQRHLDAELDRQINRNRR